MTTTVARGRKGILKKPQMALATTLMATCTAAAPYSSSGQKVMSRLEDPEQKQDHQLRAVDTKVERVKRYDILPVH